MDDLTVGLQAGGTIAVFIMALRWSLASFGSYERSQDALRRDLERERTDNRHLREAAVHLEHKVVLLESKIEALLAGDTP